MTVSRRNFVFQLSVPVSHFPVRFAGRCYTLCMIKSLILLPIFFLCEEWKNVGCYCSDLVCSKNFTPECCINVVNNLCCLKVMVQGYSAECYLLWHHLIYIDLNGLLFMVY